MEHLEGRTLLSVFQVTNANNSGTGSLRQAIIDANADTAADRIEFNIPGAGPHVVHPTETLPTITRPVVIDGYTQPGSSMNTAAVGTNAVLKIQLDGTGLGGNGLNVTGGGVTLRGLVFSNWTEDRSAAIVFDGGASNRVEGCFLGTDPTGLVLQANRGGVWVHGGVTSSVIGTDGDGTNDLGERNVIVSTSANSTGITVADTTSTSNVIAGNYFGTDATGVTKLGLLGDAIALVHATRSNRVGTNFDGVSDDIERNVIVGAHYTGVAVYGDGTDNNVIAGNYFGVGADGSTPIGINIGINFGYMDNGIGAAGTVIRGNVIAGNYLGIAVDSVSHDTLIAGNRIGTNAAGTAALGNSGTGIFVTGSNNTIGGSAAADRNIISGNNGRAVVINGSAATGNRVQGNYIGTTANGLDALPNQDSGVVIENGARFNIIGTDGDGTNDAGERNVISGTYANNGSGVRVSGATTTSNIIAGNYIGTNATGNVKLVQWMNDISLDTGTKSNRIGSNADGTSDDLERNIIAGAMYNGIAISGDGSDNNVIVGNSIGLGANGSSIGNNGNWSPNGPALSSGIALENATTGTVIRGNVIGGSYYGIHVGASSHDNRIVGNSIGVLGGAARGNRIGIFLSGPNNTIGGSTIADRNVISANGLHGIAISGTAATGNRVQGNYIGLLDAYNSYANWLHGVLIENGASFNIIGTDGDGTNDLGERNVIVGGTGGINGNQPNNGSGVFISGDATASNVIAGNYIGTDATGNVKLGAFTNGITLNAGAKSNRVGTNSDGVSDDLERNIIVGAADNGVAVSDDDNLIAGNYIGLGADGSTPMGNNGYGIRLDAVTGTVIRGNVIAGSNFSGIYVSPASHDNRIVGNRIGTNAAGNAARPNYFGIYVLGSNNTIGGGTAADRNVISGNASQGIFLYGDHGTIGHPVQGSTGNRVQGNYIGTTANGLAALPNQANGVRIESGASSNIIGTDGDGVDDAGERNVIVGTGSGIIVKDTTTTSNVIAGNYIGTNATGNVKLGAFTNGITLDTGAKSNRVGTNSDGVSDDLERNIIVGTDKGVAVFDDYNVIAGNYIGLGADGSTSIGNGSGIVLDNVVTGTVIRGNVIGESGYGIRISADSHDTLIVGNRIGTNAAGTAARGNYYGIVVFGSNNTIGGGTAADRNVISGNMYGITISGSKATGNRVQGNFIGTDVTGANPLRNEFSGVSIEGASDNQIGGTAAGQGNTIAFNPRSGVKVTGTATRNAILGNTIHSNSGYSGYSHEGIDLGDNVPSASIGLYSIENDSTKTTIRGSLFGTRNATVRVELFASPQDGSKQIFLGSVAVITGDDGLGMFLFATSAPLAADWLVTATATDPARNTSEFASPRFPVLVPDDVTSQVQVRLGGYLYNRRFQLFVQTITITNTSNTTFVGPISLAIDNLTPGVELANRSNPAWRMGRTGSPYIDVLASGAVLAPGQSLTITLGFSNPLGLLIHYTPSVLAGPGAR